MSTKMNTPIDESRKRKRGRSEEIYKRNVIKKSRVMGKEFENWVGKTVKPRATGKPRGCRKQCFTKLSDDDYIHAIQSMNAFSTKDEQDIHLQRLIEVQTITRRRPRVQNGKPRKCMYRYYVLQNNNLKVSVCKAAFASTYGIGKKQVERLCSLLSQGMSPKDMRGKNEKSNALPKETCQLIHDHIASFPTKVTHYSNIETRYLDARLNVKIMHGMFLEKYPSSGVKYKYYQNYLRENFSLRFGRPRVDTCSKCEELTIKIKNTTLCESAKRAAVAEFCVHKRRSERFYSKMKEVEEMCKERSDVLGICCDYMQNLPLPHIPVQQIFYYRQLWVNNFCIHNLKTGKARFYTYHEGIACKSPNELCSFLTQYLETEVSEQVKEVHIFSDNCGGQNKIHTVIRMLLALTDLGKFDKIAHYFPQHGHSYLPCDRDFGVVKRLIKKVDRIYTTYQYIELICQASKHNKFSVTVITSDDIKDFKRWWPQYYKRVCCSVDTGRGAPREQKVLFNPAQFSEFVYCRDLPGSVQASTFIGNDITKHIFHLRKPGTCCPPLPFQNAYSGKVPINVRKLEDIAKVIHLIPSEYSMFYNKILEWPTSGRDMNSDDEV